MKNLLVKKAKKGDKEALLELILEQKDQYYKLAYVYLKDKEDASDALSDMIVIVYDKVHSLKKVESFYSWSKSILVNICKKKLRERNKVVFIDKADINDCVINCDDKIDDKIILESCLQGLSSSQLETVKLKYYLDFDYTTIADILGIPLGTVKSRLSISLKKLKECLEGKHEKYRKNFEG